MMSRKGERRKAKRGSRKPRPSAEGRAAAGFLKLAGEAYERCDSVLADARRACGVAKTAIDALESYQIDSLMTRGFLSDACDDWVKVQAVLKLARANEAAQFARAQSLCDKLETVRAENKRLHDLLQDYLAADADRALRPLAKS